ncbi:hypothetical protein CBS101457_002610 [Exobasidium rhododendri]|nr:hypothetical protein CBS101457_002610 [Exobasidium rhododendri]
MSRDDGNLLDENDDSGFLLSGKDFDALNLADTPDAPRIRNSLKPRISSPRKPITAKRPSWGPPSSPTKGNIRLLEGVENVPVSSQPVQIRRKERTLGGLGQDRGSTVRPRQSIFAKPRSHSDQRDEEPRSRKDDEEEGDDSFYKDAHLSSSTGSVKGKVAAFEAQRTQSNTVETSEQVESQLSELRKMNDVFEAYEKMLTGSTDRIEHFAQRIAETNSLLDIYIDLMRQADRTQQLLLDTGWKGATEDESAHALALELAERERQRRQEEVQQAARLVIQKKKEAEAARLEAAQSEQRRSAMPSTRGARGGTSLGRGAPSSARGRGSALPANRTSSNTNTRGRTPSSTSTASTRGTTSNVRGSSTASGLNNRYADVRSSGYGPAK